MSEGRAPSEQQDEVGFDGRQFARSLPSLPGVYRMLDAAGEALYVGKALALDKRVASYFSGKPTSMRIAHMLSQVASMEVSITRTEGEALLLENELIKSLRPRYNILLRDDKSYPFVHFSAHPFPKVGFYRGSRKVGGRFFGPYPGAHAVRETLALLHKLFRLRSCEDSVYSGRSRPCLQHQIGRCSAPCVGLISEPDYAESLRQAALFLEGRSDALVEQLTERMQEAAQELKFEQAAKARDVIARLRGAQAKQFVEHADADLDAIAVELRGYQACVVVLSFRNGVNLGTRSYFPSIGSEVDEPELLAAFITQHYLQVPPPRELLVEHELAEREVIEAALGETCGRRLRIRHGVRGHRAQFLELARKTAQASLTSRLDSGKLQQQRLQSLTDLLGVAEAPQRIECFDISHTQGEATVASCVVFGTDGADRSAYRRFNISGITPGDDYAAMQQALSRRFRQAAERGELPDLLLIDGGMGQLKQAISVLSELGIANLSLVGVAKGEERKPGMETLVLPDGRELRPGPQSLGLQLIQQVRDEAHRFAITGHRGRRAKARVQSTLQNIEGVGPKRRVALLTHFGGLAGVKAAGVEELSAVEGINEALARRIYAALRGIDEEGMGQEGEQQA
ncbi:excinuclease ABC subunit UvrC [Pseudomarimonas arenosa]|uniref:UvrABC system protein C n=1 Tax=Pseudomarimonas arenosa TaxID=2774145 RepID=A0AAW3ZKR5_9GAMM|nr:excinuclease ABC subunit UvrC [Pseudomarimonas arenosa]MBD8525284.1 excinuclease ABC subunit UvrC [Pseudomarimonas arenosa]